MSSSGLIYAVIVGAWAAYLVPMWLRRQDELNEARPTERFTTAIRLLAGRSGLEKRAKSLHAETEGEAPTGRGAGSGPHRPSTRAAERRPERPAASAPEPYAEGGGETGAADADERAAARAERAAARARSRARLLARRRRVVTMLFLAFSAGAVATAVGGTGLLWAPLLPGALLTAYIVHLRRREVRRYRDRMHRPPTTGRREHTTAGTRERTGGTRRPAARAEQPDGDRAERGRSGAGAAEPGGAGPHRGHPQAGAGRAEGRRPAGRPGPRGEGAAAGEREGDPDSGWSPVPLPLPTYVTAPVAPRATERLDLSAPDTFSAARDRDPHPAEPGDPLPRPAPRRRPSLYQNPYGTGRFDPDEDRPRAANE